ncbi:hypothetical protein [Hyalangium versicolor]|uniref:hypothetical protein n=1 Tax=Hyalangium versicolor TaxID=2861190 RepID=UPI001CCD5141|nr:hypothetical protein [Hyalangium versicolor]
MLFSVAAVGALIGTGLESGFSEDEETPLVELPTGAGDEIPSSPKWYSGPSPEERAITLRATAGLPPYKNAVPEALAADFLDPNSRIAAAYFTTPDRPDEVLNYYQGALLDAGLPIVQHRYNENSGYVGYMTPHTKEMHMVSALAQGGETTVFVSSGQVVSFVENQGQQVPQGLPLPPGASKPVVLTFHQEGRIRYSVMAEMQAGKVQEVAAFYRRAFEAQGWKIESMSDQNPLQQDLMASRGGSRATAMASQQGAGVRLYVTLDQQE